MMLLIRCAACHRKLWKYLKIGPGEVLRCHKDRISRVYCAVSVEDRSVRCPCGQVIGMDQGSYYRMVRRGFTACGTKTRV